MLVVVTIPASPIRPEQHDQAEQYQLRQSLHSDTVKVTPPEVDLKVLQFRGRVGLIGVKSMKTSSLLVTTVDT